jgi:hypothetical protein
VRDVVGQPEAALVEQDVPRAIPGPTHMLRRRGRSQTTASRERGAGLAVASWRDLSQQLLQRVTEAGAEDYAVLVSVY